MAREYNANTLEMRCMNKVKKQTCNKKYYSENKDRLCVRFKHWKVANKMKQNKYEQDYRERSKEKISTKNKKYYRLNNKAVWERREKNTGSAV